MKDCNCETKSEEIAGILVDEASSSSSSSRMNMSSKRKKVDVEFRNDECLFDPLPVNMATENSDGDLCSRYCSCCQFVATRLYSNKKRSNIVDLEAKSFESESSRFIANNKFSRETTPPLSVSGDTEEMESPPPPAKKPNETEHHHRRPQAAEKMPTEDELDEFFLAAEKYEQRRFAEKYNYDIVNDVPLGGRYQWVRLKP